MEGRDTEKTEHASGNSCPTCTSVLIPQECTRETNMSLWQVEMNPGHPADVTGYSFFFPSSFLFSHPNFVFSPVGCISAAMFSVITERVWSLKTWEMLTSWRRNIPLNPLPCKSANTFFPLPNWFSFPCKVDSVSSTDAGSSRGEVHARINGMNDPAWRQTSRLAEKSAVCLKNTTCNRHQSKSHQGPDLRWES